MKTDNEKYNEAVKPNTAFLNELKTKLPDFFSKDGEFDLDKFKSQLREYDIDELKDGYQLNFIGKDYARRQAGEMPSTVIVPDEKQNKGEGRSSKNLFFTGDNLEVLRHLQNNYQNKINVIYIDPPYNTGKDGFVYPDSFEYSNDKLKDMFGLDDDQVERLKSIQGKSSHSAWLTFMYPRLSLAKRLLSSSGIIFISIDDNEYDNLNELMKLIFGEINQIGPMIQDKANSKNDSDSVQKNHEYILCYTKALETDIKETAIIKKKVFRDQQGYYLLKDPITTRGEGGVLRNRPNLGYTIYYNENTGDFQAIIDYDKSFDFSSTTQETDIYQDKAEYIKRSYLPIRPPKVRNELGAWTWAISKFNDNKDTIKIVKTRNGYSVRKIQRVKRNEVKKDLDGNCYIETIVLSNARSIIRFATTQGVSRINQLFERQGLFNNPKSDKLIKYLIKLVLSKDITVLDFFAGSSTTADAVMQLNAEDGGHRKFIMVQLPEKTYYINKDGEEVPTKGGKAAYDAGFKSIDQISRERIRRASEKIKENAGLALPANFDGSFKHYRVVSPTKQALESIEDFDPNNTNLFTDMVESFSSKELGVAGDATGEETILTTWLAKDGYSFEADIKKVDFAGYEALLVEDSRLYIIKDGWTSENTKALLNKVGTHQLTVQTIALFGYSFNIADLRELEIGLKQLDSSINLLKRY